MPTPCESCENCRHWRRCDPKQLVLAARALAPDMGECLRYPPRESARAVRTESAHYCGEWAARTAPVQPEMAGVDCAQPAPAKRRKTT